MGNKQHISFIWLFPVMLLLAGLVVYSFFKSITYTLYDELDQQITATENLPLLIAAVAVAILLLYLIIYKFGQTVSEKIFTIVPLFLCTAVSLYLIFAVHGLATNDALVMDGIINEFMAGDFHQLTEKGTYLCVYVFQLGYALFGQVMALLFGPSNYIAYQLVSMLSVLLTLFLLTRMTRELFEEGRVTKTAALLECGMFFLFVHTTFIYGDIPSLAPQAGALYLTVRYLKTHRARYGIFAAVCAGISSILKTNTYVAVLAMVIILGLDLLPYLFEKERTKALRGAAVCVLVLLFGFGAPRLVTVGYAHHIGIPVSEMPKGVPSSTYFAMAIQDNGAGQGGWYNGYNRGTYAENDYDWEKTDAVAKERFRNDLRELMQNPGHMVYFFAKKFLTQWGDASCISMRELELTSRHVEGHSALVNSIIYGQGRTIFYGIMKVYQVLCYTGGLIYCVGIIRKRLFHPDSGSIQEETLFLAQMFLLLYIFGGMLFHEIWEGSSRYTMRYYIFLLPFAAKGMQMLLDFFSERLQKSRQS